MSWFFAHKDERAVANEIDVQGDRGAAIIAGAMIEERLADAIRSRLHPMSRTLRDRIFNGYGPLATFSAKIDIGFAMGLYGSITCADLKHMQWIRNQFAHNIRPLSFDVPIIRNRCNHLQLPRTIADGSAIIADAAGKPKFDDQWEPPAEPRAQYIRAAKILIGLLWSEAHAQKDPQPQLFGPRFLDL